MAGAQPNLTLEERWTEFACCTRWSAPNEHEPPNTVEPRICMDPWLPRSSNRTYLDPPDWRVFCQPRAPCSQCSLSVGRSAAAPAHGLSSRLETFLTCTYQTLSRLPAIKRRKLFILLMLRLCNTERKDIALGSTSPLLIYHHISKHQ